MSKCLWALDDGAYHLPPFLSFFSSSPFFPFLLAPICLASARWRSLCFKNWTCICIENLPFRAGPLRVCKSSHIVTLEKLVKSTSFGTFCDDVGAIRLAVIISSQNIMRWNQYLEGGSISTQNFIS